jgi:uncharacterized protein YoxC
MDPITAAGQVPLSQLVVQLVTAVGVGNFVVIILALAFVVNAPSIINGITTFFKNRNSLKQLNLLKKQTDRVEQYLEDLEDKVGDNASDINVLTNEIKALVAVVDLLHSSLDKENNERRDENILITNSLEKLSGALDSIERMMRNVISEEDSAELLSFVMGIQLSLKITITQKVMSTIEQIEEGEISRDNVVDDLKNDIYSAWSDFKTKTTQFNMPIDITHYLNQKEEEMWKKGGMFYDIVQATLAKPKNGNYSKERRKNAVTKRLNIGLRRLHTDLVEQLRQHRSSTSTQG